MVFNSALFAWFLLVFTVVYVLLHRLSNNRVLNYWLVITGYWFYGTWDHRFLFLIIIATIIDYIGGLGIVYSRTQLTDRKILSAYGLVLAAAVILCAPLNWLALRLWLAPPWVRSSGLMPVEAAPTLFLPDGNWHLVWGAVLATCVVACGDLVGNRMFSGEARKKFFLAFSMVSNLTILGFFKYYDFFIDSLTALLMSLGLPAGHWHLGVILPVGISFYTFQTMSYTIDIYRKELQPTESVIDFAAFVTVFPHLVAGPIMRAAELLPQLERKRPFHWAQIQAGTYLIGWGLFQKVFVADNLSALVDQTYRIQDGSTLSGPAIVVATYAFAMQIYCDFAGYSNMARGFGRWFGLELMVNFHVPYAATNPSDFWRRWHISLSTWLRDYLYIPLGGNRGSSVLTYRNLMLTMVLGGLWHGSRANFIWWGFYQGVLLCGHRLLAPWLASIRPTGATARKVWNGLSWVLFFHLVCYGWLLFRAESHQQLETYTQALTQHWEQWTLQAANFGKIIWFCWLLVIVDYRQYQSGNVLTVLTWPWWLRGAFYTLLFYYIVIFGEHTNLAFIYFQF